MGIFGKSAFVKIMDKANEDYNKRNAEDLESIKKSMEDYIKQNASEEDYIKQNASDLESVKNNEISIKLNEIMNIVKKAKKNKYTVEKLIKKLNEKF
jgi:hypothetical protein